MRLWTQQGAAAHATAQQGLTDLELPGILGKGEDLLKLLAAMRFLQ